MTPSSDTSPSNSAGVRGRSVGLLVAFFVLLGIVACADGLFGGASYRPLLVQCGVLATATLYLIAVLFSVDDSHPVVFFLSLSVAMAAAATMILCSSVFPFMWVPFVVLPLVVAFTSVVIVRQLATDTANIVMDVLTLGFGPKNHPPIIPRDPYSDVQSGLLSVWVTAGGLYVVGRALALPYIAALNAHSTFRGFLDIRALILVTLLVPAAIRAAFRVRGSSLIPLLSLAPQHATHVQSLWERTLASVVWPLRRLAHLLYRVLRYMGVIVLTWSRLFAQLLRDMLVDIEAYKMAGKILLVFSACAVIALSSTVIAAALTEYLRQEPPWGGGLWSAFLALALVVAGILALLFISLLVTASLFEELHERSVVAAAECLGWGIVSAACASIVLWLLQHFILLRIVGFASPGVVAAVPAAIVLAYLVRLLLSRGGSVSS